MERTKYNNCRIIFNIEFHQSFQKGGNIGYVNPKGTIKREYVQDYRYIQLNSDTAGGVLSHETGHLMGAKDHYRDLPGGGSIPEAGWQNDIMGSAGKSPASKSLQEILEKLQVNCDCH